MADCDLLSTQSFLQFIPSILVSCTPFLRSSVIVSMRLYRGFTFNYINLLSSLVVCCRFYTPNWKTILFRITTKSADFAVFFNFLIKSSSFCLGRWKCPWDRRLKTSLRLLLLVLWSVLAVLWIYNKSLLPAFIASGGQEKSLSSQFHKSDLADCIRITFQMQ